ncbi:hypothetical protein HDU76_000444 [Blyttiomyces sp. JEL0837]|nr:hypothetical protein HDU76_000444 [Blyttiomyces sp. JEL0837]
MSEQVQLQLPGTPTPPALYLQHQLTSPEQMTTDGKQSPYTRYISNVYQGESLPHPVPPPPASSNGSASAYNPSGAPGDASTQPWRVPRKRKQVKNACGTISDDESELGSKSPHSIKIPHPHNTHSPSSSINGNGNPQSAFPSYMSSPPRAAPHQLPPPHQHQHTSSSNSTSRTESPPPPTNTSYPAYYPTAIISTTNASSYIPVPVGMSVVPPPTNSTDGSPVNGLPVAIPIVVGGFAPQPQPQPQPAPTASTTTQDDDWSKLHILSQLCSAVLDHSSAVSAASGSQHGNDSEGTTKLDDDVGKELPVVTLDDVKKSGSVVVKVEDGTGGSSSLGVHRRDDDDEGRSGNKRRRYNDDAIDDDDDNKSTCSDGSAATIQLHPLSPVLSVGRVGNGSAGATGVGSSNLGLVPVINADGDGERDGMRDYNNGPCSPQSVEGAVSGGKNDDGSGKGKGKGKGKVGGKGKGKVGLQTPATTPSRLVSKVGGANGEGKGEGSLVTPARD